MAGGIFDGMSHERMLQWLDQANSGTVQSAADRLATVAEEIHKIADELKIRPQWVEWKGEGADAFRAWTADLANSTLRLGDFSESSAKWLAQASDAIARAQAAIPRTAEGAQVNLDATTVAHNDPDAGTVSAKSAGELAALAAGKEKVRQEAATEMVKLGQAYEFSAVQLNALERPKFAPPPTAIVPDDPMQVYDRESLTRSGAAGQEDVSAGTGSTSVSQRAGAVGDPDGSEPSTHGRTLPERSAPSVDEPPTRMGIDSVETLPQDKRTATGPPSGPPGAGRLEGPGSPPHSNWVPPVTGRQGLPVGGPPAQGRAAGTGRMPQFPAGQAVHSPNAPRTPGGGTGIVGGRPVTPPLGGQAGTPHRGTVVGAPPGSTGRPPMGPTTGTATPTGRAAGQQGPTPGRRLPSPNGGVIGGAPQQTGRAVRSSGGSGGTAGTGTTSGGGTTRGGIVGGAPSGIRPGENRGTGTARVSGQNSSTRTDNRNVRPRRPASNEEPRRQGNSRTAPPAAD
ncbi:WXG100 family type VII secretion target [Streptomyces europaeiscabiei]|uniref:WXG100 family type VII secretion target n=1 Tax=Streptomyces europaeiscabiei TaxID=146819 RepID=UPI0029B81549|nr:translation initiation factor IF-2 [Streptomyces europaeiscabiei]MDX3582675.1 translation initiation factor IF-2 [Streptomyces europaeiscabiei]